MPNCDFISVSVIAILICLFFQNPRKDNELLIMGQEGDPDFYQLLHSAVRGELQSQNKRLLLYVGDSFMIVCCHAICSVMGLIPACVWLGQLFQLCFSSMQCYLPVC